MPCNSISEASPWYYFSPEGIGSLARREAMGEKIWAEDVQMVVDANPEAVGDDRLQSYVARVQSGEIGARPVSRGRKANMSFATYLILNVEYEDCRVRIIQQRRDGTLPERLRSDDAPCIQAAEKVARYYKLAGGRALLNRFSLQRKQAAVHSEKSRAFFVKEKMARH